MNQAAWDHAVEQGDNPYTQPVSAEEIAAARRGEWAIYLTDRRPVPRDWFGELTGAKVLALASGGGQQGPILAAAGGKVTVVDISARQLDQDRYVAERHALPLTLLQRGMTDLDDLADASFDLVVNPVSTLFVPDLAPVFATCARLLRPGGSLLTAFINPDEFIFDADVLDTTGEMVVRYPLPYVEHETLDPDVLEQRIAEHGMFHFSHTLEAQLGGMLAAGFVITGFYEDRRSDEDGNPLRLYMPNLFAVRARRD